MKKLLAIVAHPDDETFGFGGTLAKYAQKGVEIEVLCATRGEEGQGKHADLGKIREQELYAASKTLGVSKVSFMDFIDGRLCNLDYQAMAAKIEKKVISFDPTVVITMDKLGVSGHIDHIAVSLISTFVLKKYKDRIKFYYFAEVKNTLRELRDYFIYIPPGYPLSEMDVSIDTSSVYDVQIAAMHKHVSQKHDVERLIEMRKDKPRFEYFIDVFKTRKRKLRFDLFS